MQGELFDIPSNRRERLGPSNIYYKKVASILTPASGFMGSYDYTLNPYSGCSFGCTYCYAAFFAKDNQLKEEWGSWVNVKENALGLLRKLRTKSLSSKTIYLSSVTDPYQPIEKELNLTREILVELVTYHQPRLVIQTRSPLVVRDIDILKEFQHIQVNVTITTDSEKVRRIFEPLCPSNKVRLSAIQEINKAGVGTCITMTPLLPVENPDEFVTSLLETGVRKFIVQPFHADGGKYTAGTREKAKHLLKELNWTMQKYREVENLLKRRIPSIGIGKSGFSPI